MPLPELEISREAEKALAAFRGIPFMYGDGRSHFAVWAHEQRLDGRPFSFRERGTREGKPVSAFLPRLIQEYHLDGSTPEQTIQDHWEEVVGRTLAAFSYLMKIQKNGTAVVGVSHAVAKEEMRLQKKTILKRLQSLPGCSHLENLILRAG